LKVEQKIVRGKERKEWWMGKLSENCFGRIRYSWKRNYPSPRSRTVGEKKGFLFALQGPIWGKKLESKASDTKNRRAGIGER